MTISRRGWSLAALAFIVGLFLWQAFVVRYVEDDAFISFRYARHLAQGHGLVYNIGERVEGYTNFLWVVLLAAVSWALPSVDMPVLGMAAGLVAAIVTVLLVVRFAATEAGTTASVLAGLLLAVHSGFVAWSTAGLETTMFCAVVFAGAVWFVRYLQGRSGIWPAALWFGVAALTRADGVVFFAATFVFGLAVELTRRRPSGWRALLQFAAVFCAIYLPYLLWRYTYYGDLVPNTAYAKVGGGLMHVNRGVRYLGTYVLDYGVWLWIPAVALYLLRTRPLWVWYFVELIAVYLSYVVYVGGDSLGFHRFLVPVAPLMHVVAAVALVDGYRRHVLTRATRTVAMAVGGLVVVCALALTARSTLVPVYFPERARWFEGQSELSFPGDGRNHPYVWFGNYFIGRLQKAAEYLEAHAPPGAVVASTPAGAIAYYMDHPVIDMLGLTDTHIARTTELYQGLWTYGRAGHEKGDGRYVLSRAPDYILMGNVAVLPFPLTEQSMAEKLVFKSEHDLWDDPKFHERYELVSVRLADTGPFQFFTFYRRKP